MNNAEFIDGLRSRDPAAAKHLNECFVPSIWRFVFFRVGGDTHLAEDIVAEVVLALVSAAASDSSIEHPAAWLRTVAQRRIQDHFRAAARVKHLIEQVQQQPDSREDPDPAAHHDRRLRREMVRQAMDELPDNYRIALEWKYIDQLSVNVIAERLGVSIKSAESILFRARNVLRTQLKDESPTPSPPHGNVHQPADPSQKPSGSGSDDRESTETTLRGRTSAFLPSRLAGEN